MRTFQRKPHRLAPTIYRDMRAYSLTTCTADRHAAFRDARVARYCITALRALEPFDVYLYCFMPDHLHLLLVASSGDADLIEAMKRFKQGTGFTYKQQERQPLWQKSYYDHVLRRDEDIRFVARYIAENPVRAGLVEHYGEYPLTGSLIGRVEDLVA